MNTEELVKIIESIQIAVSNTGINTSADCILTNAVNYLISQEVEVNKDKRTDKINEKKPESNKATPKQLAFLKRAGWEGNFDTLTKIEASQLISEAMNRNENNN